MRLPGCLLLVLLLSSCGNKPKPQWLMPTPQLYQDGKVKPFAHLPPGQRTTGTDVFYATNRKPVAKGYGVSVADGLRYGVAKMKFGGPSETWSSLEQASTTHPRNVPIEMNLEGFREVAADGDEEAMRRWAREIDRSLAQMDPPDIVMYVHGARVGFLHACAFAAELDHFTGRDLTAVTFDWPTHGEIHSYLDRVDLRHAEKSAPRLAQLIRVLSDETRVRRIHIVSWSAGARVLTGAMADLAQGMNTVAARKRYRLGTLVFAASDVPEQEFINHVPAIHGLSDRVIVYLSDNDSALRWAARLMGGGRRLGFAPRVLDDREKQILATMPRLEVVDASYGKTARGFDIGGHRYWFQNPWVNSDVVLAIRTNAPAGQRGLKPAPQKGVWYFGPGYRKEIGTVGRHLTGGQW